MIATFEKISRILEKIFFKRTIFQNFSQNLFQNQENFSFYQKYPLFSCVFARIMV